jgi:hypothetical protein
MKALELSHQALGANVASVVLEVKLFRQPCSPIPVLVFRLAEKSEVVPSFEACQRMVYSQKPDRVRTLFMERALVVRVHGDGHRKTNAGSCRLRLAPIECFSLSHANG